MRFMPDIARLSDRTAARFLRFPAARCASGAAVVAWLQNPWLLGMVVLIGTWPIAYPAIPPLDDLGGHLGRFAIQVDGGRSASLREWYSFVWDLVPNLGTDLLVQVLAPMMGLEPALKSIVIAIVALQIAGYLILARVAHGHVPPTTLFALPLVYGLPLQYGFLNFSLSAALATIALALWIYLGNRGQLIQRWSIFGLIACLLWVGHLEGWALFCILAGAEELTRRHAKTGLLPRAAIQSVLPLSCLLVPLFIKLMLPSNSTGHGVTTGFFDPLSKFSYVLQTLRDRWMGWDIVSVLLLLAIIYGAWRSSRFTCDKGLAFGAALLAVAFLLVPESVLGGGYADMRLLPITLAIALISLRPRDHCPRYVVATLAVAGLVFAGARFAGNGASLSLWGQQFSRDLAALEAVPENSELVSLIVVPCVQPDPWYRERRTHLPGYAVARRHAFANDQWIVPGGQLLQVHNAKAGAFTRDPSQFAYTTACRDRPAVEQTVAEIPMTVEHLWVVKRGKSLSFEGWHPIRLSGDSTVYRRGEDGDRFR